MTTVPSSNTPSHPLLSGRTAIVTGGANGIGAAVVRLFAEHGARVVLVDTDRRAAEQLAAEVPAAVPIVGDAADPAVATEAAAHDPDVLVNNVGDFLRAATPFAEADESEWEALARVNLDHALRMTRAVLPGMIDRGRGGSVVNVTTVEAHRGIPGHVVYGTYKAGLRHFTRSLALEVGRHGIRVNAIAPDLIETPQVPYERLVPEADRHRWPGWAPLGGPGRPEDVAGPALFLASDLSRYVTGSTVHVDGGSYAAGGWFARADGSWTNRPLAP
ncbi:MULTISPECIES: SDR family NAD(P)-dependent oxidoreductase [Rhodococcus]|uniref:SDR family NAD(P)-dependent oxidoreductase n=1 Tax=Rhodococcus TaxID=1827 RepID=UPI000C7ADA88|nr:MULTISPECIES: SDR family NAD(P)-dependent oxidoreductase [Rhodococcus]AUM18406.1 oxidoreductase [Rhodococcus ruber]